MRRLAERLSVLEPVLPLLQALPLEPLSGLRVRAAVRARELEIQFRCPQARRQLTTSVRTTQLRAFAARVKR